MNINLKKIILTISTVCFLIIYFYPFAYYDQEGEKQYCRYRLAVYEAFWNETDEYYPPQGDTFIYNIKLIKKIGGPLEYFGLKEIKKPQNNLK